jgi:copper resistance protein C
VSSSPSEIALYFTEELEPKFSGAEARSAAGARVDHGVSVSGKVMHLSVGTLAPGNYTVKWHVTSVDTHKTQGSFSFTVGK